MNIQLMNMVVTNTLSEGADLKLEGGEQNESLFSGLMDSELAKKEEVEEVELSECSQEIASLFILNPYQLATQDEEDINLLDLDKMCEEPSLDKKEMTTLLLADSLKSDDLLKQTNILNQSDIDKHLFLELEQVRGNHATINNDIMKAMESSLSETTLASQIVVQNSQLVNENELFIKNNQLNGEEQLTNKVDDLILSIVKDLDSKELKESDLNTLKIVNHRTILDKTTELTSKVEQDMINIENDIVIDDSGFFEKDTFNSIEAKEQSVLLNSYTTFTSPKVNPSEIQSLTSQTVAWENKAEFEELMIKHASMMNDGDKTTLVINLKPYTLGEMRISLEMSDGKLKALIQLEELESKKIVEESLKMLQRDLKNSIIEVEQMYSSYKFGKNYNENHHDKRGNCPQEDSHHRKNKEDESEQLWNEMKHSNVEILV